LESDFFLLGQFGPREITVAKPTALHIFCYVRVTATRSHFGIYQLTSYSDDGQVLPKHVAQSLSYPYGHDQKTKVSHFFTSIFLDTANFERSGSHLAQEVQNFQICEEVKILILKTSVLALALEEK